MYGLTRNSCKHDPDEDKSCPAPSAPAELYYRNRKMFLFLSTEFMEYFVLVTKLELCRVLSFRELRVSESSEI